MILYTRKITNIILDKPNKLSIKKTCLENKIYN